MTRKSPITTEVDARRVVDLRREPDEDAGGDDALPASVAPMRRSATVARPRQVTPEASIAKRAMLDSSPPPGLEQPESRPPLPTKNPTLPWGLPKVERGSSSALEGVSRLLAWLDGDRRLQLEVALGRNDYARAVAMLEEERSRFPKNLTIVKAIQAVEGLARSYWAGKIGTFDRVPIRVGSLPRGRVSAEHTILKLADGVASIDDVLRVSPFPDHRTLELLADLTQKGVLSSRPPPRKSGDDSPAAKAPSLPPLADGLDDVTVREAPRAASVDGIRFSSRPPNVTPKLKLSIAELIAEANQEIGRETLPDPIEVLTRAAMTRDDPPPTTRPEAARYEDDDVPEILKPSSLAPPEPALSRDVPTPPDGAVARRKSTHDDSPPVPPALVDVPDRSSSAPSSMLPTSSSVPPRVFLSDDSPHTSRSAIPTEPTQAGGGPRFTFVVVLVLAALAAMASATALYLVVRREPQPAPARPIVATQATTQPAATTTPAASVTAAATASPTLATLTFHVEVTPPHARVFLDDVLLTKPYDAVIPKTGRVHTVRAESLGYKTRKTTFVANGDTNLIIALELLPPVPKRTDPDPYPTEP